MVFRYVAEFVMLIAFTPILVIFLAMFALYLIGQIIREVFISIGKKLKRKKTGG